MSNFEIPPYVPFTIPADPAAYDTPEKKGTLATKYMDSAMGQLGQFGGVLAKFDAEIKATVKSFTFPDLAVHITKVTDALKAYTKAIEDEYDAIKVVTKLAKTTAPRKGIIDRIQEIASALNTLEQKNSAAQTAATVTAPSPAATVTTDTLALQAMRERMAQLEQSNMEAKKREELTEQRIQQRLDAYRASLDPATKYLAKRDDEQTAFRRQLAAQMETQQMAQVQMMQDAKPPLTLAQINKNKYSKVFQMPHFDTTKGQTYGNMSSGLTYSVDYEAKRPKVKKIPTTLEELMAMNDDIQGSLWLLRFTRRAVQGTDGRFDMEKGYFMNMTYFPVVSRGQDENFYGYFIPVLYTNFPLLLEHLQHTPTYTKYQLSPVSYVNIDGTMLGDENARMSVIAAMVQTCPVDGSYISFLTSVPIVGASLGLATALAIMGAPPVAATGFIHNVNPKGEDDIVEHIDHMDIKAILACRDQYPMICPSKDVLGNGNHVLYQRFGENAFSSSMFNTASSQFKYDKYKHFLLLATTLTEAILLACHVWTNGYEQRPDIAVLRTNMLTIAADWQDSRKNLVDSNGNLNKTNALEALTRTGPFHNVREDATVDGKYHAGGRFLDPYPPSQPITSTRPSEPLIPFARKMNNAKKKRYR